MTGGTVVILGKTGRNFGAGMSGGVAYVLDTEGDFHRQCNLETFELTQLSAADEDDVRALIEKHQKLTGSTVAARLLNDWAGQKQALKKVMPSDYKRVLEAQQALLKTSNIG